jgi:hypothetical protein
VFDGLVAEAGGVRRWHGCKLALARRFPQILFA